VAARGHPPGPVLFLWALHRLGLTDRLALGVIIAALGALIGALLIGLIRSFGSLGFPLFTEGLMYLFMVIVLVARPTGLFGKEVA